MTQRYFGTDGIRDAVDGPLLAEPFVRRVGAAVGSLLAERHGGKPLHVVIGRDTRESGVRIALWLTEGLADYSALRALEVLRGPDDAQIVWDENLELLIHLMAEGYGGRPGRDVPVRPETTAELQDYVYYLKGSWVLRRLEALIGRETIDGALAAYYEGAVHAPASTEDFTAAVHQESGHDLGWFWEQWLGGTGLPEIVFAPYFDPDDPTDFEVLVTQMGDEPHPGVAWRLALGMEVGDRSGRVCMTARQQAFSQADLLDAGPLESCSF